MTDSTPLDRRALRRQLRQARRQLSRAAQQRAARALYRRIAQQPAFRRARTIAFYLSNDGEIDPGLLIKAALRRHKQVYLPVLARWPRTAMAFQRLIPGQRLGRNRFAIAEPACNRARQRPAWTLDLIMLPLVGFDPHGGRLGMGGGFYDRALAFKHRRHGWKKPVLWGLAHELQRLERLDQADWDIPLDGVITDQASYGSS